LKSLRGKRTRPSSRTSDAALLRGRPLSGRALPAGSGDGRPSTGVHVRRRNGSSSDGRRREGFSAEVLRGGPPGPSGALSGRLPTPLPAVREGPASPRGRGRRPSVSGKAEGGRVRFDGAASPRSRREGRSPRSPKWKPFFSESNHQCSRHYRTGYRRLTSRKHHRLSSYASIRASYRNRLL
jgi:hypothetical protein